MVDTHPALNPDYQTAERLARDLGEAVTLHDVYVSHVLAMVRNGSIARDPALVLLVKTLSTENARMRDMILRWEQRRVDPIVIRIDGATRARRT